MTCKLCQLPLPSHPVQSHFCCSGCHLVYQILKTQKIDEIKKHPIYTQAVASGVISHPQIKPATPKETDRLTLEIEGMWCQSCARLIELLLARKNISCVVDYTTDLALIDYNPKEIGKEKIFSHLQKLGYRAQSFGFPGKKEVARAQWLRFSIAAFCALNLMMFAYPLYTQKVEGGFGALFGWISFAFSIPLLTYGAAPIWRRFFTALKALHLGMETLILIGVSAAFCASTYQLFSKNYTDLYYDSMGMVLAFVLLGNLLEKKAKFSAKESLFRIFRTLPRRGRRKEGECYVDVPLKELQIGDTLLVKTGEKIVLDGVIIDGHIAVDESILTGEAVPQNKLKGDKVVGGSVVNTGYCHYKVTDKNGVLGRVIKTIESQLTAKREEKSLLDHLLLFFVPTVLLIALLVGGVNGVTVLLIACPCAIGIAIPLAESSLIHSLAKLGMIVRNKAALRHLRKSPFYVFDKTGTLTEGKFQLLTPFSDPHLTTLAKASSHPTCIPLSHGEGLSFDHIEERIGLGMVGTISHKQYLLGSARLLQEEGIIPPPVISEHTLLYFVADKKVIPLLLGDKLRKNLPKVEGMVLSGDRNEVVEQFSPFSQWKGECDPFEKKKEIEKLKTKRPIVMVGDGINDAPAMGAADLAISMHSGSEMACQVADILITDLSSLEKLAPLCLKGYHITLQNLFWAFIYNGIGIVLAALGVLTPLHAAVAMVLSSLSVTFNSLRLKHIKFN
ncbi:MAG: Copper-exporting P-type ATPase [Chlamydiales bacterium]|nr:Copper-exporting P-type ATPase [Chlamydiales bacterium]MCH9620073.1 Copper-exporting P-type ATPase [Chlamydiales bacterium]MCH9623508.1 Copper-exporting P-type ATPase [Chlamydiales bacterium]